MLLDRFILLYRNLYKSSCLSLFPIISSDFLSLSSLITSFYILSKTNSEKSILKSEDYLIKMEIDKESLLPFIEVFNEFENSFYDIF